MIAKPLTRVLVIVSTRKETGSLDRGLGEILGLKASAVELDSPELAALMASRKSCSTLRSEACCVRIDNERVELYANLFCEIG